MPQELDMKQIEKLEEIISESLKPFSEEHDLEKAILFLKKWGIKGDCWAGTHLNAAVFEKIRSKIKGKICVDAPAWFGWSARKLGLHNHPNILYVPEKLAIKMLTLGVLPEKQ